MEHTTPTPEQTPPPSVLADIQSKLATIERNTLLAAKQMLTLEDVEALTGLAVSTLYKLTAAREIPFSKPNGKHIFIAREDLEKWMRRNRTISNDEAQEQAAAYNLKNKLTKPTRTR